MTRYSLLYIIEALEVKKPFMKAQKVLFPKRNIPIYVDPTYHARDHDSFTSLAAVILLLGFAVCTPRVPIIKTPEGNEGPWTLNAMMGNFFFKFPSKWRINIGQIFGHLAPTSSTFWDFLRITS